MENQNEEPKFGRMFKAPTWHMPKWMEKFCGSVLPAKEEVEEFYNDDSLVQVNPARALIACEMRGKVHMLMAMQKTGVLRDERRWRAFIGSERIRILGHAKLGNQDYQHVGLEIHSTYQKDEKLELATESGRKVLTKYVDAIIESTVGKDEC